MSEHLKDRSYEEISDLMDENGIVIGGYPPEDLKRYKWVRRLRDKFHGFARMYEHLVLKRELSRSPGDWGYLFDHEAYCIFPNGMLDKIRHERYLVRRTRNIFGKVIALEICRPNHLTLAHIEVQPKEPVSLRMPGWTDYSDLTEIILASNLPLLNKVEKTVSAWQRTARLPIAMLEHGSCPAISYRQPFDKVWMIRGAEDSAYEGLIFHRRGETEVKVHTLAGIHGEEELPFEAARNWLCYPGLPACMDVVAAEVLEGKQGTIGSRLYEVISKSNVSDEIGRELLEYCSSRTGIAQEELIRKLDPYPSPYALHSQGRLFVQRNGIYLMRDRKGRWQEISNFSISITETFVRPIGDKIYELMLSIDRALTTFRVTVAVLENSSRLWQAASRAAALAGLPEMIMPNNQHRRLIPSLIKRTAGLYLKKGEDAE